MTFIPTDDYGCQCGKSLKGIELARHRAVCPDYRAWFERNREKLAHEAFKAKQDNKLHVMLGKYNIGSSTLYHLMLAFGLVTKKEVPKSYRKGYRPPKRSYSTPGARLLAGQPDPVATLRLTIRDDILRSIRTALNELEATREENKRLNQQVHELTLKLGYLEEPLG